LAKFNFIFYELKYTGRRELSGALFDFFIDFPTEFTTFLSVKIVVIFRVSNNYMPQTWTKKLPIFSSL